MGLFTRNIDEIREKTEKVFHDRSNYVLAIQNRSFLKRVGLLLLAKLPYLIDSNRTFLLYFNQEGIYEAEISFSDKSQFLLMPWHEISDFHYEDKGSKVLLSYSHLGQKRGYSIDFGGPIMKDNRKNVLDLIAKDWNRI